jgi:host factor-I protein
LTEQDLIRRAFCAGPRHDRVARAGFLNNDMKDAVVANEKSQNVQDVFLNHVRKNKTPVTVFLVNGVKLQGIITWFDNFSVLLRRDGHTQLVYKHAISTVMPGAPIQLFDGPKVEVSSNTLTIGARETAAASSE